MNCKQGDIAYYVGRVDRNHGRFVKVVEATTHRQTGEPSWITEPPLFMPDGGTARCVVDRLLRPIRPGDVTDSEVRELYAPKLPEVA